MGPTVREAERLFLELRDAHDALEVATAQGRARPEHRSALEARLAAMTAALDRIDEPPLPEEDRRALDTMRRTVAEIEEGGLDVRVEPDAEGSSEDALTAHLVARYSAAQAAVPVGPETLSRPVVLARLGVEPDAERRRRLFLALEPIWRSVDGDADASSPYRRRAAIAGKRWASGDSPIVANARSLGLDPDSFEPSLIAILEAWRDVVGVRRPIEPWDWWYLAGAADRALEGAIPLDRLRPISDAYHRALGADPSALSIRYDLADRPGRPPIPVAYTTFGRRSRIEPQVFATYTTGGLGNLTELLHETGHAIHIAAIQTRPAFADWPDSDAFSEALAELTALDSAEPAWQERWLGRSLPAAESLRGRYADVMLDVAWALLELRVHADPAGDPNTIWTDLTHTHLGVVPHPEWSWWAIRGQLVQVPGYMANYAIGAILAADMRAAIRAARGDWSGGDPGWYAWVAERLYRFGRERASGDVLAGLLGRPPDPGALLAEIRRIG